MPAAKRDRTKLRWFEHLACWGRPAEPSEGERAAIEQTKELLSKGGKST